MSERRAIVSILLSACALALIMAWVASGASYLIVHSEVTRVCATVNEAHLAIDGALNVQYLNQLRTITVDKAALAHPFHGRDAAIVHAARVRTLMKDEANAAATAALIRHVHISRC